MVFASDTPFEPEPGIYIRETIELLDRLEVTKEQRDKIYYKNAKRLLKAVKRGRLAPAACCEPACWIANDGRAPVSNGAQVSSTPRKRIMRITPPLLFAISFAMAARGATCESLAKFTLTNLTVNSAAKVRAGDFTPPGASGPNAVLKSLPAFCRVLLTLTPSADSDIKVEVWLPLSGWNNKYEAVGNGGWAGAISYPAMGEALKRGYATSSTDTGHVGGSGSFALGHPEKLADFGWRSEHEMAEKSKRIIAAFYGQLPKFSYWNGCSTGGRQGLQEVQRFPDDFQGVIAGAAASPRTGQAFEAMWIANAVLRDPASFIPPRNIR